jgi:high-affinity nickel-transport protein
MWYGAAVFATVASEALAAGRSTGLVADASSALSGPGGLAPLGLGGGVLLGLVVGVRHAFEPDHLAAVSTLVTDFDRRPGGARRGALVGAVWGIGHTLALVIVGLVLIAAGALVPASVERALELGVAVMLVGLGVRAITRAVRDGRRGAMSQHVHLALGHGARHAHAHAAPDGGHVHVAGATLAWRPLAIGVIHGLAGSGGLTALVFAELPGNGARIIYMTLFGAGSVAGMALASGLAGMSLARVARAPETMRRIGAVAGVLSIIVGVAWGIPLVS